MAPPAPLGPDDTLPVNVELVIVNPAPKRESMAPPPADCDTLPLNRVFETSTSPVPIASAPPRVVDRLPANVELLMVRVTPGESIAPPMVAELPENVDWAMNTFGEGVLGSSSPSTEMAPPCAA